MLKNKLINKLARIICPYGALRKVIRGPLAGTKFYVAPSMGLTYLLGSDSLNWKFFRKRVNKGMIILDVGANRGQMGLFFSKLVGLTGKVYCFEPMKSLTDELTRNLSINHIQNVTVLPYALSDKDGVSEFLFSDKHSTQGKINGVEKTFISENAKCIEINTRSLDGLLDTIIPIPNLIKIDVEGAASLVFEGAKKLLDHHPDIYLELHGPEEQKAIGKYLVVRGYKFEDLNGNRIADPVNNWYSPIWCSVNN